MTQSIKGQNILITGASSGIGRAIALACAKEDANLILFARSEDKLSQVAKEAKEASSNQIKVVFESVDVQAYEQLQKAIKTAVAELGQIDVLVNNAGLALGAPAAFPDLSVKDITTMINTNITGVMYAAHAVLNSGMRDRKRGTILNITSTTGLEVPPFPGEAVYHSSKACQEAFTNTLRTELQGTNIKVLALRPGVVATNFHEQRVGYDKDQYDTFMDGFEPLVADDVAENCIWMLKQSERLSVTALSVTPTAQRILPVIDKTWNKRNGISKHEMGDKISKGAKIS